MTLFSIKTHCPLCTIGTGAATAIALWLGISKSVVALFLGAFAVAIALWINRSIHREYLKFQRQLIVLISFLTTVLPVSGFLTLYKGLYIDFIGEYGTVLVFDVSLAASIIGGLVVLSSPHIDRFVRTRFGFRFPHQKTLIAFLILVIFAIFIHFWSIK